MADLKDPKPQADKFRDLARELEADEDESHFEETVRKIAPKSACRHCAGTGKVPVAQDCVPAATVPDIEYEPCANCGGTGLAPPP